MPDVDFNPVTIETVDRAIRDWFDKTVDVRVDAPTGLVKVPVQFSQGERWAIGRTRQAFRDDNGVLILPIIAIRRTGIAPDPTKMALGVQTEFIQVAKKVDPKSNAIQNLESGKRAPWRRDYPPVYDVYTIPFPDRVVASYQVVIQTQFIAQMNQVLQKMWRSMDIQKSFVAPLQNDGRHPPRLNQYGNADPYEPPPPLSSPYVVGFMEGDRSAADNFEEFTDTERIIKYTTELTVPCALQPPLDGEKPTVQVQRTAYKVVMKDENVVFVNSQEELDAIFGKLR